MPLTFVQRQRQMGSFCEYAFLCSVTMWHCAIGLEAIGTKALRKRRNVKTLKAKALRYEGTKAMGIRHWALRFGFHLLI